MSAVCVCLTPDLRVGSSDKPHCLSCGYRYSVENGSTPQPLTIYPVTTSAFVEFSREAQERFLNKKDGVRVTANGCREPNYGKGPRHTKSKKKRQ
jgi:hypothetical protein